MIHVIPWILNLEPRPPGPDGAATIREAIYAMLAGDPTIVGLVGDRIRPGGLPQSPVYPSIAFSVAGRQTIRSYDGAGRTSEYRVTISCWSPRVFDAAHLAESIRDRLVDAREVVGRVEVLGCSLLDEIDFAEAPTGGTDQALYQTRLDLRIWRGLPPRAPPRPVDSTAASAREALHDLLVSTPGLAVSRINPNGFGQNPSGPRLVYSIGDRNDARHFGGSGSASDVRFRVSAQSSSLIQAAAIAELVHDRLVDFRGGVGTVEILGCEPLDEIDFPTAPTAGADQLLHQVAVDYRLWRRL